MTGGAGVGVVGEHPRPGWVTWTGLAVVAAAAAVLTFATVQALAANSGYPPGLDALLPVVIDATAVVGSHIWLGRRGLPGALRYARALALTAAAVTVAANVVQHGLAAHHTTPPWWLVAALAAVPPIALVAVAHLVALLTRPAEPPPVRSDHTTAGPADTHPAPPPDPAGQAGNGHRADAGDLLAQLAASSLPGPGWSGPTDQAPAPPDHRPDRASTDTALGADLRRWADRAAATPSRNAVMGRYRIGATRATRLLTALAALDRTGPGPVPDHEGPTP